MFVYIHQYVKFGHISVIAQYCVNWSSNEIAVYTKTYTYIHNYCYETVQPMDQLIMCECMYINCVGGLRTAVYSIKYNLN